MSPEYYKDAQGNLYQAWVCESTTGLCWAHLVRCGPLREVISTTAHMTWDQADAAVRDKAEREMGLEWIPPWKR